MKSKRTNGSGDAFIMVRLSPIQLQAYRQAASAVGYRTLSPWVRMVLDAAVTRAVAQQTRHAATTHTA